MPPKKGNKAANARQQAKGDEDGGRKASGRKKRQELPGEIDSEEEEEMNTDKGKKGGKQQPQQKPSGGRNKREQVPEDSEEEEEEVSNGKGKKGGKQQPKGKPQPAKASFTILDDDDDDENGGSDDEDSKSGAKQRQKVDGGVVSKTARMKKIMAEAQSKGDGSEFVIKIPEFSLSFAGLTLLENTTLTLAFGRRYGFIGANGLGKSTLLRHISQRLLPGIPKNIQILHVEQEVDASTKTPLESVIEADEERTKLLEEQKQLEDEKKAEEDMLAKGEEVEYKPERDERLIEVYKRLAEIGAHTAKARAYAILTGLQFTEEMIAGPTSDLSGGWRMRIALARALFCRPHLLLLDEPTNHLDLHACVWLDDFLSKWKKTLLIVSHDVDLLNNVCTDIIWISRQKLHQYRGNYQAYERIAEEQHRQHVKAYEKQQKIIKQMKIEKGKRTRTKNG